MSNLSDPAKYAAPVTPSDVTDLTSPALGLYVGVSGNITMVVNGAAVLFSNVPVGIHPVRCTRVNATGTTATNLVALW